MMTLIADLFEVSMRHLRGDITWNNNIREGITLVCHNSHFNPFSSAAQSCPTLCDPMECSMSGFPVHHQLLELTQIHAHQVGDAIQPSHPLSSPSPPAFNLSQHQSLFQWVSSSNQSTGASALASFLPMNIREWIPLGWTGLISLQSKGLSRVFCNTTVQKHQFFSSAFFIV